MRSMVSPVVQSSPVQSNDYRLPKKILLKLRHCMLVYEIQQVHDLTSLPACIAMPVTKINMGRATIIIMN